MLWIKDCGAHFNHFRIVKRRIEEDQINNGGNGMTPSAIVTDEIGSIDLILKGKGENVTTRKDLQTSYAVIFSYNCFAF